MIIHEEREKLYKLEKEILEKGPDFYYSIVRGKDDDFLKYIISKRIHSFRHGLFPTNKKIILKEISDNWKEFLNKSIITNEGYLNIIKSPPIMQVKNKHFNHYLCIINDSF